MEMRATILPFLRDLKENNNREWFQENRTRYAQAKKEMESLVDTIIPGIAKFDPTVKRVTAKESLFRIFRDIRFATDKLPYKTNFGAWISREGRKSCGPGFYIHVEPKSSFIAVGVYMPGKEELKRIRQEIFYNAGELKSILNRPSIKRVCQGLETFDKLKRPPRDFPGDFPDIEILKNRHFIISHHVDDDQAEAETFPDLIVKVFEVMVPFNVFLARALEK